MDEKIVKFEDSEIGKYKSHQYKSPISIDINKIVVSNKVPFSKKI